MSSMLTTPTSLPVAPDECLCFYNPIVVFEIYCTYTPCMHGPNITSYHGSY